jgi:hypothetical protein
MKTFLLLILFIPFQNSFAIKCNIHFDKKLSPAELEAKYMKDIGKSSNRVDKMREAQGQILTQSAIAARNQVRLLNSYLNVTSDPGLLYAQFKSLFFKSESGFLKYKNFTKRITDFEDLKKKVLADFDTVNHEEWAKKFELYGLGVYPKTKNELVKSLDSHILNYQNEILLSSNDLISQFDNYLGVRFGLDEIIESPQASNELKEAALKAKSRLSLDENDFNSYPYVFAEQRSSPFNGITQKEFKELVDQNLELKSRLWDHRQKQEVLGLTQHVILKARLHSKIINYVNQKIPNTNAFYKKLRQILARYTKDITDYEMQQKHSGFIALQLSPAATSKSLDEQMKLFLNSNAHSDPADQYMIALARSVDGRQTWESLKKFAASTDAYTDVIKRMETAEVEARILGDMKIGKGGLILANLPIYAIEVGAVWVAYEYLKIGDVSKEEILFLEPETEEARALEDSLHTKLSEEQLDKDKSLDTLRIQLEEDLGVANVP